MSTIQAIIERAVSDPDFLKRLAKDPVGAALEEGFQLSAAELQALLGVPGASDREVVEALQSRLSPFGKGGAGLPGGIGSPFGGMG